MSLFSTSFDENPEGWVTDCGFTSPQAHFSDTEDDCSSRTPASRQLSADVKQVRRPSQRSKVSGQGTEKFEKTDAHTPHRVTSHRHLWVQMPRLCRDPVLGIHSCAQVSCLTQSFLSVSNFLLVQKFVY